MSMKSACGEYECPCHDEAILLRAELASALMRENTLLELIGKVEGLLDDDAPGTALKVIRAVLSERPAAETGGLPARPRVVCLCGSTRFLNAFREAEFDETLAGRIVLTIGCDTKSDGELFKGPAGDAIKARLDVLHKQKIDLAHEILVLNVGGYIGDSTRSEIAHAEKSGKTVRWLEPPRTGDSNV